MDHSGAILHWRKYVDLDSTSSATVSTMLFGCEQWLAQHPEPEHSEVKASILNIQQELETWLATKTPNDTPPTS
ncbi:MAG: hypothetical protein JWQ22_3064 [Devosia sp.]|nr:hypothetical protein [Devosia sp.]